MQDFITVGILNSYITSLFNHDELLQNLWVKGELSGYRRYQQSGHSYFTLKDEDGAVSCVMFKSRGQKLTFKPEDGMEVLVRGYVSVFAKQGKYQVYVEEMQPSGIGGLFLYLEKLKARLNAEGCFAPERKRKIPRVVNRVGVVTSQDGAAWRDILKVIRQRHAGAEVIIAHSSVQGNEAGSELARAVQLLNEYGDLDVIIVGRGGGSLEDLMAFNNEELVYAVCNSSIPVISGVGHEVDFTLCDLAADLRAATPTQAAQFAVPDHMLLQKELMTLNLRMARFIQKNVANSEERLDRIRMERVWKEPGALVQKKQEVLHDRGKRLQMSMEGKTKESAHKLALAVAGLDNLSPLKVLGRGYVILSKAQQVVKDISDADIGDELQADLINGRLQVVIKDKEKVKRWKN